MPTGYTAPIADGITFEQYAWSCARAFGALVTMRDEPQSAPIPERLEPSDYHQKALERTHTELDRLLGLSADQIAEEAQKDFRERCEAYGRRMQRAADLRIKYGAMLAQVRAWESPTPDHDQYKAFMASQIEDSMKWDCNTSHDEMPERQAPAAWIADRLQQLRKDLVYHEKSQREEVERTGKRNQWIADLRASLA
ncbi:hypothetical protein PQR71_41815 [Paraburkholderia fungorum]|uniref:hypothetical protein n=1 Tax=Paraburkholderia fungorum TaxID=134537 RepID=UPI0038BD55F0